METIVLYTVIIIYSLITGFCLSSYQLKTIRKSLENRISGYLLLISLPLLLILVSNDTCTDFYSYVKIFDLSEFHLIFDLNEEIGWIFLNSCVKIITQDGVVGVNILRGLTYLVFLKSVINLKNNINVGWAWIAFVCMGYFNIFSMVAFMLAVGFILLAFSNLINKNYLWVCIDSIVAFSMHYTAIIPLFIIPIYVLYDRPKYKRIILWSFIACIMGCMLFSTLLLEQFMKMFPLFSRYAAYGIYSSTGTGLRQFINYLPIFICLYFAGKKNNNKIVNLAIITAFFGLTIGIMSYSINNLLRTYLYFIYLYIVFLPAVILEKQLSYGNFLDKKGNMEFKMRIGFIPVSVNVFKCLVLSYLLYRMIYLLSSEWEMYYSSGFSEFHFLF